MKFIEFERKKESKRERREGKEKKEEEKEGEDCHRSQTHKKLTPDPCEPDRETVIFDKDHFLETDL